MEHQYVKNQTIINESGIYRPLAEYTDINSNTAYQMILSREDFIKAYVKYIRAPAVFTNQQLLAKAENLPEPSLEEIEKSLITQFT